MLAVALFLSLSVLHASGRKEVGSGMLASLFFSREGCCSIMNPFSQVENLFINNIDNQRWWWWWWWWFQSEGMQDLPFSRSNLDACEEQCKWGFSVLDVELDWVHIPCPWAALASSNFLAANSMCIGWCVLILCICCMAGRAQTTGCRCAIWGSTASAEQWTIAFLLSQETTCWYQASKQKQVRLGFRVYGLSVCLSVCLPTSPCWHCCGSNFYSA